MKIAPIDVAHKTFQKKMMGYDPDMVSDFLRVVADEMENLVRERNSLKEAMREKELSILEYKERDKVLRDTITSAQKMAEKMREDADRESKLIVGDANQKADIIVREARDSLKRVYQEISDIKRAKIQFEAAVRMVIQSHSKLLEAQSSETGFVPKSASPILAPHILSHNEMGSVDFAETAPQISPLAST